MNFKSFAYHLVVIAALLVPAYPQTQPSQQGQIPDAPTPSNSAPSFPTTTAPASKNGDRPVPPPPSADEPLPLPPPPTVSPKPMPNSTKPANGESDSRDDFTIKKVVNLVVVPVTVKDSHCRYAHDLPPNHFSLTLQC